VALGKALALVTAAMHDNHRLPVSHKLASLFLAITAVTDIEEFYMLRQGLGGWDMFPTSLADRASVLLVTIVFLTVSFLLYALMRGGRAALVVLGLFGLLGVGEAHHWIEAIAERAYDPGLVTSVPYVWIGTLILIEVALEWRATYATAVAQS
jgi:hypothetical protein